MSSPKSPRRHLLPLSLAAVLSLGTTVAHAQPEASTADSPTTQVAPKPGSTDRIAPANQTEALGKDWKTSTDRAWLTSGDGEGVHVLVADAAQAYRWQTIATLAEPGLETDQWISNACVTGSGRRAVVVYAPRTFTNKADMASRGGFTAVVDLQTGTVTKLAIRTSLAYFNPSCGAGEEVVLTQEGSEDLGRTRLVRLDAATATIGAKIETPGQLTSAVPTPNGIVAADNGALVKVDDNGTRRRLAPASGVPFKLAADSDGGVVYMERSGDRATVRRAAGVNVSTLASGALADLDVTSGKGGRVFVTGAKQAAGVRPASVTLVDVPAGTKMSTEGQLAVTSVRTSKVSEKQPLTISANVRATNKAVEFAFVPSGGKAEGLATSPSPGAPQPKAGIAAGSPTDPADMAARYCSVPRNDPRNQAMQPKPRQVEWAVDQAVRGALTSLQREANWKNLGMPAYSPGALFPSVTLSTGGNVPAQVMLGIAAQESNMWQAARFAVPGVTANPLIGNYYGLDLYNGNPLDDWVIRWDKADCGYGITQLTDGMRLQGKQKPGETPLPYDKQRAVALDFAANVASGVKLLQEKWNLVNAAGMKVNNGDPSKIENWFFAIWAYNSGFHTNANDGQPWGLGWANNPVNPHYPANRAPFLEETYTDAAHPQDWPYPEKVLGWAGHPVEILDAPDTPVAGFRPAWWNGDSTTGVNNRRRVKPPVTQFCDSSNQCEPGHSYQPNDPDVINEPAGPCAHKNSAGKYDLKCWYHQSSTWKSDCSYSCGNELLRFDPGYAYQADGTAYPPACDLNGLPGGALVIDDVPGGTPSIRPGCGQPWTNYGSFGFTFKQDAGGEYPGKIDTHQIGGGFGGHLWFSHTRWATAGMTVTGTWTMNVSLNQWARVMVHLPDQAAWTQQAKYVIDLGSGTTHTRYLPQKRKANNWVSLGVYPFAGTPKVSLSTDTEDGRGDVDIAWDAVAFQPLAHKPAHIVAALGDSYTSGEGAGDYITESDRDHGKMDWNACRRSVNSWPRKLVLRGNGTQPLGALSDSFNSENDLANVACSGAKTQALRDFNSVPTPDWWSGAWSDSDYGDADGQFREMNQTSSGALTPWTTLVVLTIGGNNKDGFANAMKDCSGITPNCSDDSTFLPKYKGIIDQAVPDIGKVIEDISAKAPNAQIVLMGYPELLSRTVKCSGSWYYYGTEVAALAELVNYMDSEQEKMVTTLRTRATNPVKVEYKNPVGAFVGHGGCDSDEWINKIVIGPNGDGDFHKDDPSAPFCLWPVLGGNCLSRESFHPKKAGTDGYARVMEEELRAIHY